MLNSRYPDQVCSVARALEVVGERWSLLILRDAMLGVTRFEGFLGSLGIARNVLTDRLDHLVSEGVLARRPYGRGQGRFDYEMTDKGRGLGVAVLALMKWGDRHYPAPGGPPRLSQHRDCGSSVDVSLDCRRHGSLATRDLSLVPGPGAMRRHNDVAVKGQAG
ncbi:MAG: winged helix-turn-helix transcriptional regulator [Candidatus Limnocylindria bacterium]